jgi:hypothetical protein
MPFASSIGLTMMSSLAVPERGIFYPSRGTPDTRQFHHAQTSGWRSDSDRLSRWAPRIVEYSPLAPLRFMPFHVAVVPAVAPGLWAVLQASVDFDDPDDALVSAVVAEFRRAYGEDHLEAIAIPPDTGVASRFDLRAILAASRMGMIDPETEGNRPAQLRASRSEAAEMVARVALRAAFDIDFPVAAQVCKGNASQPVLGYDGWGVVALEGGLALALVQVKATDDPDRPPAQSGVLERECCAASALVPEKIARALCSMVRLLDEGEIRDSLLRMMQQLGKGEPLRLVIAPVLVRGNVEAHVDDLAGLISSSTSFIPAEPRGAVAGVGVELGEFGVQVTSLARAEP